MPRAARQRDDRRSVITRALYRCISEQGYANTTLRDIAERADMSPSHVGYYFDNKRAILLDYGQAICAQNLRGLPELEEADLDELADGIATFCFGTHQTSAGMLGVIQELTGLAVHDEELHAIKARHTTAWRQHLERFFERTGVRDPRVAACSAHAMLVGLNTNMLFDSALDREIAHDTFRHTLRSLAGLTLSPTHDSVPRSGRAPGSRPVRRRKASS